MRRNSVTGNSAPFHVYGLANETSAAVAGASHRWREPPMAENPGNEKRNHPMRTAPPRGGHRKDKQNGGGGAGSRQDFASGSQVPPDVRVGVEKTAEQERERNDFSEQQPIDPPQGYLSSHVSWLRGPADPRLLARLRRARTTTIGIPRARRTGMCESDESDRRLRRQPQRAPQSSAQRPRRFATALRGPVTIRARRTPGVSRAGDSVDKKPVKRLYES